MQGVCEDEKVEAALVAMEGVNLSSMQWWACCLVYPTWNEFQEVVINRADTVLNPYEVLLGLRQEDLVLYWFMTIPLAYFHVITNIKKRA